MCAHASTLTAAALEKSPTAQDFTDIAEVAEDEGALPTAAPAEENVNQPVRDVYETERLYQKGMSFAQSQLAGEEACIHN